MATPPILEISGLSKDYGEVRALDNASLAAGKGEILGLLGPNGAGKTTLINIILGILAPSTGRIVVLGERIDGRRGGADKRMNFAAVYAHLPANLTVCQNLYIFGMIYEVRDLKNRIRELLREFDLERYARTKAGLLSSGEASRLNLAKAVINRPALLLLDEPTASLDPSVAAAVRQKIKDYAVQNGAAVLWTSHNMNEIEAVCNRVLFLSRGRIIMSGDPRALPAKHGRKNLEDLFVAVAREPLREGEQ